MLESGSDSILQEQDVQEKISHLEQFVDDIWSGFLNILPTLIFAIIILILGILLQRILLKIMEKGMKRSKVDQTVVHFMHSLVKIVGYTLLITIVLAILGVPMTSIIAVVGTAGVAIGLAMQDSLANLAGGILILLSKPFKVGDFIVTNDEQGCVERINIWYTKLNTVDNKAIFIPNGKVTGAKVVNCTQNEQRAVETTFSISYNADFDTAKKVIQDVVENYELILQNPEPMIKMSAHSNSSIDIFTRLWVNTEDYWTVHFEILERVRKAFIENDIEIPFNQLDVHLINN